LRNANLESYRQAFQHAQEFYSWLSKAAIGPKLEELAYELKAYCKLRGLNPGEEVVPVSVGGAVAAPW